MSQKGESEGWLKFSCLNSCFVNVSDFKNKVVFESRPKNLDSKGSEESTSTLPSNTWYLPIISGTSFLVSTLCIKWKNFSTIPTNINFTYLFSCLFENNSNTGGHFPTGFGQFIYLPFTQHDLGHIFIQHSPCNTL